ncbi:TIGR02996 domain-containing protein [Gemmata sp. JC717]|uniref:TIGR02996 domain-containing protein n=1 Tax=Gemmata algarum TaxID=2975278 RepID=UPI0021BAA64A|nr:TIGR02996 domain-containing protein [Gemmata algarum]MDY3553004.1 TIGR02996 domain-containing protein [Gemmata algarum]
MSEDEAFIRAVVDSPGDDTPRLVYADWLDDRADPRGPYLRAEREAIGTGSIARLHELAAGLDPVWVARVSMPPVGVCCNKLTWLRRGETITGTDLDRFETRFGVRLPVQYRAFLMNYNGGAVELDPWETPNGGAYRDSCEFYSLARTSRNDPPFSLEYEFAVRGRSMFQGTPREDDNYQVRLRNSLSIGTTPGNLAWMLLGIGQANAGGVRSLSMPLTPAQATRRATKSLSFRSLTEYLSYLRKYRVSGLGVTT